MQPLRVVALTATLTLAGQAPAALGVLRATPSSPADPSSEIAITFDRPVAGGLATTIEADAVFTIEPRIDGRFEWRDPMTVRFLPARPLAPEATYTLTVRPGITAMDGSTLEQPYVHAFTVAAPRVLGGDPAHGGDVARYLPASPRLRILISSPADERVFERTAGIRPNPPCTAPRTGVRVVAQRRTSSDDPRSFEWLGYRGPWPRDTVNDTRRVLEIEPVQPLSLDCSATLVLPWEISATPDSMLAWSIRTYGPLRVEAASCNASTNCPTGPIVLTFSTPVRGADVQRHVHVAPGVAVDVRDTSDVSAVWRVAGSLAPRRTWTVSVDPALTDVFGQRIGGALSRTVRTTGYLPSVSYEFGRLLVERDGLRTLPVQHVNVDSLILTTVAVPDSLEAEFLARSWNWGEPWALLQDQATRTVVAVNGGRDERRMTGVRLPLSSSAEGGATLHAVRISSSALDSVSRRNRSIALVQVTDLAVHARVGLDEAMVWVTGVSDGEARAEAQVRVHDARGRVRGEGRTDASGLARIAGLRTFTDDPCNEGWCDLEGYVAATLADDRAVVGITSYDPDLAPWRFGINAAWQEDRAPRSAALFTERGIYRPGEDVIAKAIVRDGPLGDLRAPVDDSIRWVFRDREGGVARDTIVRTGEFGTDDQRMRIPADAPLGHRSIELQRVRGGEWRPVAWAGYSVAEYRPPEFLVEVSTDPRPRFARDTLVTTVAGRYLFGAPMAGAAVRWTVMERPLSPWEIDIPGYEDWRVGVQSNWWEDDESPRGRESGVDTLDATGHVDLHVPLPATEGGRGASVTLQAMVTDANRQVVTAAATARVHPAAFYLATRVVGSEWFWRAGQPVTVEVAAVTPEGSTVSGSDITGTVVRREWHRVRRVRDGQIEDIGGWVSDTVATCALRSAADPASCTFTPVQGGSYTVAFEAADAQGRTAVTSFPRWASGPGWVPWNDDTELKMDIVADRERYAPGDTATLLFASPFTDAEAWVTVERERVIESRRIRIEDGATTLRLPITEAHAPNVFVSIVVVRGRSAEPGPLDDPGRPTLRVGYAELRVLPDVKRLNVAVMPLDASGGDDEVSSGPSADAPRRQTEYRPGDTARVALHVTDLAGRGRRAEVTLWAVDVGVLALTGYRTPDPLGLLYAPRGVGMRLASNLVRVAPQVPDGEKGNREAGGGGGGDDAGILRSRFQTTAFFLGSVVTDANGRATARAKLPDNLTTFRVMAVAVTPEDRFGSGDAEILVTRPLVARPALPRFLRVGDEFAAGVVVNQRLGGTPEVEVRAEADNVRIRGGRSQKERLDAGRGREFRFAIEGRRDRDAPLDPVAPDSAWFRFDAKSRDEADAVRLGIPYRVAWHPLAGTIAGVLRDTATAQLDLTDDVAEDRSRLRISIGASPLGFIDGARMNLRLYPYLCTEQVSSIALPTIALLRAGPAANADTAELGRTARDAVRTLLRRQTAEGGIGYWSALDWTTPWLSGWAGRILLEARDAGIAVDSASLARIADYVQRELVDDEVARVPVAWWYTDTGARLSERVAATDFLSRYGRPDAAAENVLLTNAGRMRWEDRVVLAEMLHRRGQTQAANALLDAAWTGVGIEGRTATLPDDAYRSHYFASRLRPAARLLSATLRIRPDHPGIPPLAETLVVRGRSAQSRWNTQDYGWAVLALADYQRALEDAPPTDVRVRVGRRTLLAGTIQGVMTLDTMVSLDGLIRRVGDTRSVDVQLESTDGRPVYWFATVTEVPRDLQTTQVDRGIAVERWYERVADGTPVVAIAEGDLVRVRLRITVPEERRFVVVDDPLPAGLEAVDLSLRTLAGTAAFASTDPSSFQQTRWDAGWYYGSWDAGYWSPFDHKEMRDDRVVYSATLLWPGTWTASYLARATTPGTFIAPPAHAEEMYNPGVNGRTAATRFVVEPAGR